MKNNFVFEVRWDSIHNGVSEDDMQLFNNLEDAKKYSKELCNKVKNLYYKEQDVNTYFYKEHKTDTVFRSSKEDYLIYSAYYQTNDEFVEHEDTISIWKVIVH